ncbi:MAG TPA: ChaN family lipoprotein [Terriglobales bacterium]|nr:ChaN family lipoprotein [Terriglobales bacterium]
MLNMATTGILRTRRTAAQLHALASVEREIRSYDHAGGRKYLRDFRDAYQTYTSVLEAAQVRDAIAQAEIVLVGDYHALASSQRYLASLIRDPELNKRPLVIGLETIFARDQHIVDEWWRGEIDESELRQRIRFDLDWGYDWTPFYELLTAARQHAVALYGLDCMPREDLRKIGARDRHAAGKIAEIRRRHPEALVLVLFGESHLAPAHLPAQVRTILPDDRTLIVLQNVDALYWHAAGEKLDHVEAVSLSDDTFCVFNSTPLEKYENYRLYLNRCVRDDSAAPDLRPTVYNLIDGLVRFLGINLYSPHNTTQPLLLVDLMPEVYSRNSDAYLRRLLSRKGFSATQRRSMLRRVHERGSTYLAPLNAFYIRKFEMISATEDAARFLHHACRGVPDCINGKLLEPRASEDAFFIATLENALACFGSRILYPARPAFRDAELGELLDLTREDLEQQSLLPYADVSEILNFLAWHRRSRRARRTRGPGADWARVLSFTGQKRDYVTEKLGCLIGNDLYDGYIDGRIGPPALRRLFLAHIEQPGSASQVYANLNARLK